MIGQVPSPFHSGFHQGTLCTLLFAIAFGTLAGIVLYKMLAYAVDCGH